MPYFGCHLSSAKGFAPMVRQAQALDADTFQFFTRNPRGSKAKTPDSKDLSDAQSLLEHQNFGPTIAHAPYTMNLCNKELGNRGFSASMLRQDLQLLQHFPSALYNFHPGCHVGQGLETGVYQIASSLVSVLIEGFSTTILLETMAGKGTEIGGRFEELKAILDAVQSSQVGVCLDTCHVWDAGYDIAGNLEGVLEEFDRIVGLDRLKALHINDSKNPLGAHKDRHACLGDGFIGLEALERIVTHPALSHLPMVLETPNDLDGYSQEIQMLRMFKKS